MKQFQLTSKRLQILFSMVDEPFGGEAAIRQRKLLIFINVACSSVCTELKLNIFSTFTFFR